MPKIKENSKIIIYQGLNENYIVQKSRPLMLMKTIPFSLGELKVLDVYLSRINSHNDGENTVRFGKEEYEDLMGIERMRPERLVKYVKMLMGQTVTVPDEEVKSGWSVYTLFEKAQCYKDDNEQWWIDLTCTQSAKKLMFNIESIGYIRYHLKNVLPLTSKHSVLLYIYITANRYRGQWQESLDELRHILKCDTSSYYEYKHFRAKVFKKAVDEVNEKTDMKFSTSTSAKGCKVGRFIENIEFTIIKENAEQLELENIQNIADTHQRTAYEYPSENMAVLAAICQNEFSPEDMTVLMKLLVFKRFADDEWETRGKYLDMCYAKLNREAKKTHIKDRFKYLQAILENDTKDYTKETKTEIVKRRKSRFANFEGRKIDYNEIERLEQEKLAREYPD